MENNHQLRPAPMPSVGDAYGHGWETLKKYFVELLLVIIIAGAVGLPSGIINSIPLDRPGFILLKIIGIGYAILLVIPIEYGAALVFLKLVRGEPFEIKDMFKSFDRYLNVIGAALLVAVVVIMGIVFLIVPGIIFACKLAFVPYLVMDKDMEPVEAFKKSWEMTRGHTLNIFLIGLIAFPLVIAGLLLLIIGIIPAIMWIDSAFATIYYSVSELPENKEQAIIAE